MEVKVFCFPFVFCVFNFFVWWVGGLCRRVISEINGNMLHFSMRLVGYRLSG